ncbi:MAG: hypothetical protein AAGF53_03045 [Pseudomonadota bacterium]
MTRFLLLFAALSLFPTASIKAAPLFFDSLAAFEAAIGDAVTTTETFATDVPDSQNILFDGGISAAQSGAVAPTFLTHRVVGGLYIIGLDGDAMAQHPLTTLTFPESVIGVGFEVGGIEPTTLTSIDGGLTSFNIADMGLSGGFFGVVDTSAPFSTLQFRSVAGAAEGFTIQNLVTATERQMAPVPLPANFALVLLTLLSFGAFARQRR